MKYPPRIDALRRHLSPWVAPMLAGVKRARTTGLAAEMSFWVFLSVVPLAAVAGLVAARLAAARNPVAASALASVPADARRIIEDQLQHVAAWRGGAVAPLAIATFVWLASSGVHAVFDALQVQAGGMRPWWRQRALAIATCFGLSVGVAVLGLLATGVHWIEALAGMTVTAPLETAWTIVLRAVAGLGVATAMVGGLYWVGIPRHARATVPRLPGAAFAVMLIAALGWGYGAYVSTVGNGGAYVGGTLATIGVTLMTLWLFSVALLLGAQLNQVISDRRTSRGEVPRVAGRLPEGSARWPSSDASSSRPTSPKPPTGPSIGPSRWRPGLGRPSR